MWNAPTLEEIEVLRIPSIASVVRKSRKYRQVYMHFFSDAEEYYVSGHDPTNAEFIGYDVGLDSQLSPYGAWLRMTLDELISRQSSTGAEYTWNSNFKPCRATTVPIITFCEKRLAEECLRE